MSESVQIRKLPTGVEGLDEVLGGGIPELSFTLVVGGPGCGKTTLGHQILFANATPERPGIYFTIIGEPPIKMLRYQQQYSFFDAAKIGNAVRFVHLGTDAGSGGLSAVLARIVAEVEATRPAFVVVDSFRSTMGRAELSPGGDLLIEDFVQRLALQLTAWEATTFLLGEFPDSHESNAVVTVADGIIALDQSIDRNSVVRKLQVVKMRGQGQIPGLQTMRITRDGLTVFPRILKPSETNDATQPTRRLSSGIAELDEMFGGGIPSGYSVLVAGPSGSGKTLLANQFVLSGLRAGEPAVIAVFEKRPNGYTETSPYRTELDHYVRKGTLELIYVRPLDLSIDEALIAMREAVMRTGARRAVIDSLSGLELALAPTFREDFRESLYRMVGSLTELGVTVMSTVELRDTYDALNLSPQGIAFLTDAIVLQRYLELDGELRRALCVVKVRGSQHSKEVREYVVEPSGSLAIRGALRGYVGLLTGGPRSRT
jgi:circadian clock protein KaiC